MDYDELLNYKIRLEQEIDKVKELIRREQNKLIEDGQRRFRDRINGRDTGRPDTTDYRQSVDSNQ